MIKLFSEYKQYLKTQCSVIEYDIYGAYIAVLVGYDVEGHSRSYIATGDYFTSTYVVLYSRKYKRLVAKPYILKWLEYYTLSIVSDNYFPDTRKIVIL